MPLLYDEKYDEHLAGAGATSFGSIIRR